MNPAFPSTSSATKLTVYRQPVEWTRCPARSLESSGALLGNYRLFRAQNSQEPIWIEWLPDGAIGWCSGALRSFLLGIMRTSPRVDARYAARALPRYTGGPKTKPCDLWCDLAACFWHFWHFESFVPCITYVFSV